ncbi:MAG: nitroreductase family protein [Firmicutes bacterium]|nr:nitroreductase family protein [Bacillota bacterium]
MDLVRGIKERRSIRKFQDKPVPHDLLTEVVEIARFAPSWKNTQIARYIIVEDREKIAKIATEECTLGFTYNIKTMAAAPALVLLTYLNKRSGYEKDGSFTTPKEDRWEMFDAGIAAQTFCLAAHEKGLGTVIMGVFDENKIGEIVEIPQGQTLAAVIPVGFPAGGEVACPPRKAAEELISFV